MKRFTILSLMGLVLALAIAIAALRNADDYWASGMILATPFLLGVALIAALCGEDRSRARRLGFAILGGGYFALAFLGLSESNRARLPTTQLLTYVHQQVAPPQVFTFTVTTPPPPGINFGTAGPVSSSPAPLSVVATNLTSATPGLTNPTMVSGRWKAVLPGAANYEAFSIVGHCLFVLLAGLLGASIAQWFRRRAERANPSAQTTTTDPGLISFGTSAT